MYPHLDPCREYFYSDPLPKLKLNAADLIRIEAIADAVFILEFPHIIHPAWSRSRSCWALLFTAGMRREHLAEADNILDLVQPALELDRRRANDHARYLRRAEPLEAAGFALFGKHWKHLRDIAERLAEYPEPARAAVAALRAARADASLI